MSFADDKEGERRRKNVSTNESPHSDFGRSRRKRPATPEVGQALRAAYDRTLEEDIPPEMLDLLGKLG